jgi:hypothetical protein
MKTHYVLYIELFDDPPRVAVFDTRDEAEMQLDAFEVSVFDPPQFNPPQNWMDRKMLRAQIFECTDVSWGVR